MKHIVLVWWKPDAEEAAIKDFLDAASGILERAPFISCEHGTRRRHEGNSADWAFIGELPDGAFDVWGPSEAHQELHNKIAPIVGEFRAIDI